jgi:ferredoxin/flavodoxin
MNILAFYFSGTGNTKFVVEEMKRTFETHNIDMTLINIEAFQEHDVEKIKEADRLLFAYPVYGSMAPMIMWQFIKRICPYLDEKKTMVVATQLMFSGDGGAYLARILRKCYAQVISIEHFNMPSNLSDVKLFKVLDDQEASKAGERVKQKIELYCMDVAKNILIKRGDGVGSILLGSIQRIPFSKWERKLAKNVRIDPQVCNTCGHCVTICPMDNLFLEDGKIAQKGICTLCYRCVNQCPEKAMSILSKKPPQKQYRGIRKESI